MTKLFAVIEVGLDAASEISKSKIEKAGAPVAAAVVGIGLFLTPIEKVEAQASREPATINFVNLVGALDSTPHLFDVDVDITYFGSWSQARYVDVTSVVDTPGLYQGGYVIISFDPVWPLSNFLPLNHGDDDGWVEVWIWMGYPDTDPSVDTDPVAYVYDSLNSSGWAGWSRNFLRG